MIAKKAVFRKELLSLRKTLSPASLTIDTLKKIDEFRKAKCVFCYVSAHSEVGTLSLLCDIAKEKILTVPFCTDNEGNMICVKISGIADLCEGRFGILEPKEAVSYPKEKIDFAIVPGIAFDKEGGRLGYGKGYYDRFLSDISPYKAGVCQKELLLEKLPCDEFDVKMDKLITI